jgi:ERCC4-type nuclease
VNMDNLGSLSDGRVLDQKKQLTSLYRQADGGTQNDIGS